MKYFEERYNKRLLISKSTKKVIVLVVYQILYFKNKFMRRALKIPRILRKEFVSGAYPLPGNRNVDE
jgi:hypothetical protein